MSYKTFVDGIEYRYDFERSSGGDLLEVIVYDREGTEEIVRVTFDHNTENATVDAGYEDDAAPFFELVNNDVSDVAAWAVNWVCNIG